MPEVKIILLLLFKVTENETGSQLSDTGPLVLWFEYAKPVARAISFRQSWPSCSP